MTLNHPCDDTTQNVKITRKKNIFHSEGELTLQNVSVWGIMSSKMKKYLYGRIEGAGRAVDFHSPEEQATLPRDGGGDRKIDPIEQYRDVLNLLAEIIADDIIARGKNND